MATSGDDDLIEIEVSGDGSDVLASPTPMVRPWTRGWALVGGVSLVAGAILGYVVGVRQAVPVAGPPPTPSVAVDGGPGVADTGMRCSAQVGSALQLGVAVTNQSAGPVLMVRVRPTLPLGGLVAQASTWGTCGEQFPTSATHEVTLAPGATIWVTVTFGVQQACPAPLPVFFNVVYNRSDEQAAAIIAGFNDLGDVPYSGCGT
jgi:hypothetical protein